MMEMEAPIVIGGRVYPLRVQGETMEDILRQIGPWQDLERHAKPGCVFQYRKSKDNQFEFYSLYHAESDTELPLGVRKNPKGQIFAGKVVEEGGRKRVVVEWKPAGGGSTHVEDEESTGPISSGDNSPQDQPGYPDSWKTTPQKTQPTIDPQVEAERRAAQLAVSGHIAVTARGDGNRATHWSVADGSLTHAVWYDSESRPQCNCPALVKNRSKAPGYRCAHILAVKKFYENARSAKQAA